MENSRSEKAPSIYFFQMQKISQFWKCLFKKDELRTNLHDLFLLKQEFETLEEKINDYDFNKELVEILLSTYYVIIWLIKC